MKRRKRRPRLALIIIIVLLFLLFLLFGKRGYVDYHKMERLQLNLHSRAYLLYCVDDNRVLYGCNKDEVIYPASLTKLMCLDVIVSSDPDWSIDSSFSYDQWLELVAADASLAGLACDFPYSLEDLSYALILPSGADAAVALENYQPDLVSLMNKRAAKLKMKSSHFTNPMGLHDDALVTTLSDLLLLSRNLLKYDVSRQILSSSSYMLADGQLLTSSLAYLCGEDGDLKVLGGKTGFTPEAGENLLVYYRYNNKDYLLLLAGADGNPYEGEYYHFADALAIFKELYQVGL